MPTGAHHRPQAQVWSIQGLRPELLLLDQAGLTCHPPAPAASAPSGLGCPLVDLHALNSQSWNLIPVQMRKPRQERTQSGLGLICHLRKRTPLSSSLKSRRPYKTWSFSALFAPTCQSLCPALHSVLSSTRPQACRSWPSAPPSVQRGGCSN